MSKVLCTFPGKFGDILWSLPTVRLVAEFMAQEQVDFGIMPAYWPLLPLLSTQKYIKKAFCIGDWVCEGSPFGDQPWHPQHEPAGYDRFFHLGLRGHPGIHCPAMPLIDFIADQQGMRLVNPIPFIEVLIPKQRYDQIAYAFSDGAADLKARFMDGLMHEGISTIDVSRISWMEAARVIRDSVCFVGSRSSNNVIAHGVGQKNIFIYEPEASRHASGPFGMVFGCPYDEEHTVPPNTSPEDAAVEALKLIRGWREQFKEVVK